MGDLVLCLFCGAGGSTLGIHAAMPDADIVGIDNDRDSCLTHQAAGFPTIRADLATLPKEPFVGKVTGLWASPPCTDFSRAGKRAGVDGETGKLIYCAMDWARTLTPPWVVFEQVPEVLAYWERFAERSVGYWTWTGILNLANFGVPQTRERAFLLASRLGPVFPPEPTHAQHPHPSLFGPQRRPWMSMADALGWLETDQLEQIRGSGMTERHGTRPTRKGSELAFTVTGSRRWKHHVLQTNRGQDEQGAIKVTLAEVARLQDFPDGYPFKGNKRSVGRQIGNAVPPALAEACVRAVVRSSEGLRPVTPDRVAKDSALAYPVNLSDQELLAREKCRWAELQETPRGVPWHAHVRENWLVLLREVKRRGLVDRIRWDKEWGVVDRIRWDKD